MGSCCGKSELGSILSEPNTRIGRSRLWIGKLHDCTVKQGERTLFYVFWAILLVLVFLIFYFFLVLVAQAALPVGFIRDAIMWPLVYASSYMAEGSCEAGAEGAATKEDLRASVEIRAQQAIDHILDAALSSAKRAAQKFFFEGLMIAFGYKFVSWVFSIMNPPQDEAFFKGELPSRFVRIERNYLVLCRALSCQS